jgi:predicted amidohydrolase YtcJ
MKRSPADLVIRNVAIFSAVKTDTAAPAVGSLAVTGDRINFIGPDSGVADFIGASTEVIDGFGKLVTPGFIDSHTHPYSGTELLECDLSEDSTESMILASVRRCAARRPAAEWVRGSNWQLPVFANANPSASLLDQAVPDRPAYLIAADGHSAWVNSRALALANLTATTPDPANGRIERDAKRVPTGTLRESAMNLVSRLLPPYTVQDYVEGFERAFTEASSLGITAVTDANADSVMLEAYRVMDSMATLPVRVTAAQDLGSALDPSVVERVRRWRDHYRGPLVSANSAKIFMDGVIESRTAALLQPYLDRPGFRGEPNLSQVTLDSLVAELDRAGIQVHVHAIGDRAIRMSLDAFERARANGGSRDARHQIAHLELIDPADIPRFQALGVIANFQPLWAYDDSFITDLTIPALGPARSRWLYPVQSVLATGATIVGGSDWSVSSMNPLEAVQVAVTRRAPDAAAGEGWIPEERASLRDMLHAYTINGAFARFAEDSTGSLEVGKLADLVLLDRNLFAIKPHEIARAQVLLTIMDGRVRYRSTAPTR